ncbi:MAG: hypothetical protein PVJ61_07920 [Dehalococcoidia bacterium]|jgi:hypothetical protein
MPRYDFTEVHTITIKATPEAAYRAVEETTWAEVSPIVRWLFFLRELPEKLVGRKGQTTKTGIPIMEQLEQNGFTMIEKQPPREDVFGLIVPGKIGRVWNKKSGTTPPVADAAEFLAFKDPDYLLVMGNLLIKETDTPGVVTAYTESRTMGLSPRAVKDFAPYWRIIRPFSGLIRRLWLRGIRRHAERG